MSNSTNQHVNKEKSWRIECSWYHSLLPAEFKGPLLFWIKQPKDTFFPSGQKEKKKKAVFSLTKSHDKETRKSPQNFLSYGNTFVYSVCVLLNVTSLGWPEQTIFHLNFKILDNERVSKKYNFIIISTSTSTHYR